jgi:hypothetical protein
MVILLARALSTFADTTLNYQISVLVPNITSTASFALLQHQCLEGVNLADSFALLGGCYSRLGFSGVPHREIRAIRMVKHYRAHAGFRVHHHAFGELHSDLFRSQQLPDSYLIL